MVTEVASSGETANYPVTFDVAYPDHLSRLLIFVKFLLAFPHFLIVYVLGIVSSLFTFIAFFAILFTKRYPRGLFDFVVNENRWSANLAAYTYFLRDEYPPFSWDRGEYPVTYEVTYPDELNRWLPLVKWFLAIPHQIVLFFLGLAALVVWVISWFAILLTGGIPRGMFDFMVGTTRWTYRVAAYTGLMTDEYPPFSLK